jgi:hypothetical protein
MSAPSVGEPQGDSKICWKNDATEYVHIYDYVIILCIRIIICNYTVYVNMYILYCVHIYMCTIGIYVYIGAYIALYF